MNLFMFLGGTIQETSPAHNGLITQVWGVVDEHFSVAAWNENLFLFHRR